MLKKFIAHILIFSLVFNNLAFATNAIIELDFKDSQTPQRLHVIPRLSSLGDVSHVEIDLEKRQGAVYRIDPTQLPEKEKHYSGVHPRVFKGHLGNIDPSDLHHFPWDLSPEKLTLFLLAHTAWLSPLGGGRYIMVFKGSLLGGMMKKKELIANVYQGNIDCQGRKDWPSGTIGSKFCNKNDVGSGSAGVLVMNKPSPSSQSQGNQAWGLPGGMGIGGFEPQGKPYKGSTQIKDLKGYYGTIEGGKTLVNSFRDKASKMGSGDNEFVKLVDHALAAVAKSSAQGEISSQDQEKIISTVGVEWDDWSKSTNYFKGYYFHQGCYEKGYGLLGSQRKNNPFVRQIVKQASDLLNKNLKAQQKAEKEFFDQAEKEYLKKTYPVFHTEYDHFKEIQRRANTVNYSEVFKYTDPLGYSQDFVRSIDRHKPYTLEEFLEKYNPFYRGFLEVREIQRLAGTVFYEEVFKYSDPLGYDREFVRSIPYDKPFKSFEGYMTETFDDQVLEDWGAKDWRDALHSSQEGEPQIVHVNLFKKIIEYGPKGYGFCKEAFRKALQAYKGQLSKDLKLPQSVQDKLTKELGQPKLADKKIGLRWTDKHADKYVRVMKADKTSPHVSQHQDYVQVRSGGKVLGKDQNPVLPTKEFPKPSDNPESHIPYKDWIKWDHPLGGDK